MEKVEVTRQELYDLVWSKPMSKLALEYNMSDNGLRKICKKFDIPLPLVGHWQKIQYNKKINENEKHSGLRESLARGLFYIVEGFVNIGRMTDTV